MSDVAELKREEIRMWMFDRRKNCRLCVSVNCMQCTLKSLSINLEIDRRDFQFPYFAIIKEGRQTLCRTTTFNSFLSV